MPNPAKKTAAAAVRQAEAAASAAEKDRDAAMLELRSPPPGQPALITNQQLNQLNAPVEAVFAELDAAAATPPASGSATSTPASWCWIRSDVHAQ